MGEMQQIGFGLEANQIIGKQGTHQPFMRRDGGQNLLRWQGDVQKEADTVFATDGAQFRGQRNQVIVVNPDQVIGLEQCFQLARKQLIDAPVSAQMSRFEMRQIQPIVEYRPQHAIGIAAIVGVMIFLTQIQFRQRHAAGLMHMQFTFAGSAVFDHLATPAEPQTAGSFQGFPQRYCKTAGGGLARISQTVRYHNQARHKQTPLLFL